MTLFKDRGYLQLKVTIIGHNKLSLITFWDHFLFILTCVVSGALVAHVNVRNSECTRLLRTFFYRVWSPIENNKQTHKHFLSWRYYDQLFFLLYTILWSADFYYANAIGFVLTNQRDHKMYVTKTVLWKYKLNAE